MIARIEKKLLSRGFATIAINRFGKAADCLESLPTIACASPIEHQVSVKIGACQVSTEDSRAISGLSFLRKTPGIAGSTGVGHITSLGPNVGNLSIKDQVLVVSTGVWTDFVTVPVTSVVKIPQSLSIEDSAALPAALSAYAILNNFVDLKAGDVVVQYGGNTAVGMAITQIGTASGYKVVNAGQAEISDAAYSKTVTAMGSVKLTITNTSKKAISKTLMRCLAPKGSLVMYQGDGGNDDSDGVDVPVGSAIFKANSIFGFNFNSWMIADPQGVAKAMAAVSPLVNSKAITFQSKVFPQPEYLKALGEIDATGGSVILKL